MTSEALNNLARIGKIKAEPMNRAEIDRMLAMARKRLEDAAFLQISEEGRFTSAYNAIHSAALAALRWHGYRSENRYIVFNRWETHLTGQPTSGACWMLLIKNATSQSMKVSLKLRNQLLQSCSASLTN